MGSYLLSERADNDIEDITQTTVDKWDPAQADIYVGGLHDTFERLANFPELGRDTSNFGRRYRWFETASHVIFFRVINDGILIVRILHERMDFRRHL